MASPTTLFLDYDGTTHGWPVLRSQDLFEHLPALEATLRPFHVRLVLSTSWVERYGLEQAASHLTPWLRERVVGSTFDAYAADVERYSSHNRAEHIEHWLRAQRWPRVTRYVVVDDAQCEFAHEDRVVRCNPDAGLTAADLERLRLLLCA